MNHPSADPLHEIEWMAAMELDFIDLTLEPPGAASWNVDARRLRVAIEQHRMSVVGHTAWYLPLASAIPEIRAAAVEELRRCAEVFSEIGAKWMNIHPDRHTPWHSRNFAVDGNLESLERLHRGTERLGIGLMIENLPGDYNCTAQLAELLDPLPWLGLHLDIGHANLRVPHNTTSEILHAYGDRLRHVHLHDNKGGDADLHLPLGAGNIDLRSGICALQGCGYDGTVTLEVFTDDRHHLAYSRHVLRRVWDACLSHSSYAPEDVTVSR
ncbi:MAG TPA: sugar phosphate isomerase/epimerase family protein [Bryobacteraceae bacterium]|nr:sugar phosphate isomerase/epimerase family protein [Bryobacteraceae bacterium]